MYRILTDEDIRRNLDIETVINIIEQTLRAKAEGSLVAPQRFSIDADEGRLVFTAGAEQAYTRSIGFRVYETFSDKTVDHQHLVAVFDSQTGEFKGLVIGKRIGAMRTVAINAVALKTMARPDVANLGILGSGFQARFHTRAALVTKQFKRVKVFSSTASHCEAFSIEVSAETGIHIEAVNSAKEVVEFADVLICATTSPTPVLNADWVKPGAHVNTIGPKFRDRIEIPYELAQKSQVIATDSFQQVDGYSEPFFLLNTLERERMIELSEIVVGNQKGRDSIGDITLFCSVGLAGTEVAVANEALKAAK